MFPPRRPTALEPDEENAVIRFIGAGNANDNVVTQRDILHFVESEFGKCLIYGWMHNILLGMPIADVVPLYQDKITRIQIHQLFLDKSLALIK
jgi:hypothetical protein